MKHNLKITFILLGMFIVTQFIGLYVVNYYSPIEIVEGNIQNVTEQKELPFGMETPEIEEDSDYYDFFSSILLSLVIAISLLFLLTKFKAKFILKLWFFIVVMIALGISINSFIPTSQYASIMSLIIALPLAFIKIYKKDFLVHNLTELFIYPGIAAVFVPLLNLYTIIILLIIISIYDIWAVWHSGIMQKMAKYQINELKIFSGFFVPYISKKMRAKIRKIKKSESKNIPNFWQRIKNFIFPQSKAIPNHKNTKLAKKGFKVNVAILGGGDVIFPIITAGIMLKTFGLFSALFVIAGATLALSYLFFFAEKKKFYPAMPFITAGIFLGMILSYFLL